LIGVGEGAFWGAAFNGIPLKGLIQKMGKKLTGLDNLNNR
jgi:hypothetical protein